MKTIEIERKFLVRDDAWQIDAPPPQTLLQGYLSCSGGNSVRVRIIGQTAARLTIKTGRHGLAREEYEYAIPVEEARSLLSHAAGRIIEKQRYRVAHDGAVWEVDVFGGAHRGLTIAEIELSSEGDRPSLPRWLGREVTGDPQYSNRALAAGSCPEDRPGSAAQTQAAEAEHDAEARERLSGDISI